MAELRPTLYIAASVMNAETLPQLREVLARHGCRLVVLRGPYDTVPPGLPRRAEFAARGFRDVDFEADSILHAQRTSRRGAPFGWISRQISSGYREQFDALPGSPDWWIWKPWIGGLEPNDLDTADAWLSKLRRRPNRSRRRRRPQKATEAPRTLFLLDVDGVLLPAPDVTIVTRGGLSLPGPLTTEDDTRQALLEDWGDVATYIHPQNGRARLYSPSAVEALNMLIDEFHGEVVYHSTWVIWPELLDDLIATLGLPPGKRLDADGYDEHSWSRVKKSAVRDFLEHADAQQPQPVRVVLIDDHAYAWADWVLGGAGERRLVLHPATHRGITPATIERARRFLNGNHDDE